MVVLDDLSTGTLDNLREVSGHPGLEVIIDSVNNAEVVDRCVREADYVYHLASAVGVRLITDQPVRTIESIVGGTEIVLKACAAYRKPFLLTSTSEVYGKGSRVPFSENDDTVMGPTSKRRWSYACAKALDEFLALAHWVESRLPVTIVRLFNTVGPRQTGQYGMVIPTFVRQALAGEKITVYGDGNQSRCFAHVHDVVGALMALRGCPEACGQVINIGNDSEITIAQLAERVKQLAESTSEITFIPYDQAYGEGFDDMMRRVPELTRIKKLIGYQPQCDLDRIILDVIADQRQNAHRS